MKTRLFLAVLVLLPFTANTEEVAPEASIQGSYFAIILQQKDPDNCTVQVMQRVDE